MTITMRFTTSRTSPNDIQRRMRPRSLTARESSWPLGHRSWKLTGRSCSFAYRALRMLASTRVPGVSTNQRRSAIMPASSTPSPKTRPASGQIALASPSASGPSTTDCSTCGIARAISWTMSAETMPAMMNGMAGPAYSRSLKSARTVPMRVEGSWWCWVADKPVPSGGRRRASVNGRCSARSGRVDARGRRRDAEDREMGRLRLRGRGGSYPAIASAGDVGRAAPSTATWRA